MPIFGINRAEALCHRWYPASAAHRKHTASGAHRWHSPSGLSALLLVAVVALQAQTPVTKKTAGTPEQRTARYFESIRESPPELLAFLLEMPKGGDLHRQLIDGWSMRSWRYSGQSGHDHFFDAFGKFGAVSGAHAGAMLAEVASHSAKGHVSYPS